MMLILSYRMFYIALRYPKRVIFILLAGNIDKNNIIS